MQPAMFETLERRSLLSSAHFINGPTFTDQGTTLKATGSIAGLGNGDVTVLLNAQVTATIICTNPSGNVAPGQTSNVNVSGQQTITDVKNGRINFSVTTIAPTAPAKSCPNNKWTASVTNVNFSSATLTIEQGGQVVLTASTTF